MRKHFVSVDCTSPALKISENEDFLLNLAEFLKSI